MIRSPKGSSCKPMRFSIVITRQSPDVILPILIDQQLNDGKGNRGHSEVHEDVVSESETGGNGEEVSQEDNKQQLGCEGEVKEVVGGSLGNDRQLSCFADESIEDLADDNANQICSLSILASLGGVADR